MNTQETNVVSFQAPSPSELTAAIAAVMGEVARLEKSEENTFAKYQFTSVDDYKDHLRPLLAAAGLTIGMTQASFERFNHADKGGKESVHCQYDFDLWLSHVSGEVGMVERSTVCLPFVGAQTNGIARSYCLKEWLKSKFLASSGDIAEDADHEVGEFTKAEGREVYERMATVLSDIGKDGTDEDLKKWTADNKVLLDSLPGDWKIHLRQDYHQAQLAIQDRVNAEIIEQNMPADIEKWLSALEVTMAAATDIDTLNEVWVEAEDVAHVMRKSGDERAFDLLRNCEQDLKA